MPEMSFSAALRRISDIFTYNPLSLSSKLCFSAVSFSYSASKSINLLYSARALSKKSSTAFSSAPYFLLSVFILSSLSSILSAVSSSTSISSAIDSAVEETSFNSSATDFNLSYNARYSSSSDVIGESPLIAELI